MFRPLEMSSDELNMHMQEMRNRWHTSADCLTVMTELHTIKELSLAADHVNVMIYEAQMRFASLAQMGR